MVMKELDKKYEKVTFLYKQNPLIEKIKDTAKVVFDAENVAVKEYSMNSPMLRLIVEMGDNSMLYEVQISEIELFQRYTQVVRRANVLKKIV